MSVIDGPNFSSSENLIFYLDAVNPKSYPGTGSTWYDVSGNNNHFTLFNTPTYTQNGTTGTYLSFNGTNQYARSANAINFNAYSAVTLEIGYRSTVTNATQILYETTGTGGSTATGGITLLMNSNNTSTSANIYLSMWQGYGPRLFGYTVTTTTIFNCITETFVNGVDSSGRQALINGTTAQFFTNTAVTVVTSATTNNINGVDILVIGGGGAGGHLGGGGAGGHRYFTNQSLVANTNYTVTVGAGGTASTGATGNAGSNSVFNTYTSAGGGGGAGEAALPAAGGSGGGGGGVAGTSRPGAAGNTPSTSPSQGNTGGNGNDNGAGTAFAGGGGGGAGGTGDNASGTTTAGNGGLGTANSITGTSVTRAAGGGGGAYSLYATGTAGTGGSSIGGNGGRNGLNATSGSPNTGSGGGGNGYTDVGNLQGSSGAGGSGVVIIKYSNSVTISNPGGGLTFTTDSSSVAGYNITTFTAGTGQVSFTATSSVTGILGAFANTWTYVASRAGTSNFFNGDIAWIRAFGIKISSSTLISNLNLINLRQPASYTGITILSSAGGGGAGTTASIVLTASSSVTSRFGDDSPTVTSFFSGLTSSGLYTSTGTGDYTGYYKFVLSAACLLTFTVGGASGGYSTGSTGGTYLNYKSRGRLITGSFNLPLGTEVQFFSGKFGQSGANGGAGGGGSMIAIKSGGSLIPIIVTAGGGSFSAGNTVNPDTAYNAAALSITPTTAASARAAKLASNNFNVVGGGGWGRANTGNAGFGGSGWLYWPVNSAGYTAGYSDNINGPQPLSLGAQGGYPTNNSGQSGGFGGGGGGYGANYYGGGGGGYNGGCESGDSAFSATPQYATYSAVDAQIYNDNFAAISYVNTTYCTNAVDAGLNGGNPSTSNVGGVVNITLTST